MHKPKHAMIPVFSVRYC